jgi:hypothetical protein
MGAGSIGAGDGYRTMGTVHGLEHGTGQRAHGSVCQYAHGTAGAWNDSCRRRHARRSCDGTNGAGNDTGSQQDAIDSVRKRHGVDPNQQTAGARHYSCRRGCACRNQRQSREGY